MHLAGPRDRFARKDRGISWLLGTTLRSPGNGATLRIVGVTISRLENVATRGKRSRARSHSSKKSNRVRVSISGSRLTFYLSLRIFSISGGSSFNFIEERKNKKQKERETRSLIGQDLRQTRCSACLQFELWKKCIAIRKPLPWEDEANRKSSYLLRIVINAGGRLKTDVA